MGFIAGNAQDIGSRPQQQDAFGFSDPSDRSFVGHGGFLGIVADGVGGLTHGSEASQSAVRAFLGAYRLKSNEESIPDALLRSLREANQAVMRVTSQVGGDGAATTLAAAVLSNHFLYWISAGDTRIYQLHAGRLTQISLDHTYAHELDEQAAQGKISQDEALHHPERGSLTSYLGQAEPKEVGRNVQPLAVDPDDSVILCTDGFYRALDESEIVGAFDNNLQSACEKLVNQALAKQRRGQDNLTVIALKQKTGRQEWPANESTGGLLGRRVLALACVVLVGILAGVGYWYKERANRLQLAQPPRKGPAGEVSNSPANKSSGVQSEQPAQNLPHNALTGRNGDGKVQTPVASGEHHKGRGQASVRRKKPRESPPSQTGSGSTPNPPSAPPQGSANPESASRAGQNAPGGTASPGAIQPSAVTPPPTPANAQGASGEAGNPPVTQPQGNSLPAVPPAEQNGTGNAGGASGAQTPATSPPSPPAGPQGQGSAPPPTTDSNPQKPPATPAPANDAKPKSPPNLAFGGTPVLCFRPAANSATFASPTCSQHKEGQL